MKSVLYVALVIVILVLVYLGPYIFVYARTATWTFPRIDERDIKAIHEVDAYINSVANLTKVYRVHDGSEANYSLNAGILNRKFLDWIGFPLVLEVSNFTLKASGIYLGKVLFHCNYMEADFPKPGASQPWYIYQSLVDKYDNTTRNVPCYGDASLIEKNTPTTSLLNWSLSGKLIGDRNDRTRTWTGSGVVDIADVRK
jgi:hypothetical protein